MPCINYLYYYINIAGLGEPFAEELVSSLGDRFDPTLVLCFSLLLYRFNVQGKWSVV